MEGEPTTLHHVNSQNQPQLKMNLLGSGAFKTKKLCTEEKVVETSHKQT